MTSLTRDLIFILIIVCIIIIFCVAMSYLNDALATSPELTPGRRVIYQPS